MKQGVRFCHINFCFPNLSAFLIINRDGAALNPNLSEALVTGFEGELGFRAGAILTRQVLYYKRCVYTVLCVLCVLCILCLLCVLCVLCVLYDAYTVTVHTVHTTDTNTRVSGQKS